MGNAAKSFIARSCCLPLSSDFNSSSVMVSNCVSQSLKSPPKDSCLLIWTYGPDIIVPEDRFSHDEAQISLLDRLALLGSLPPLNVI